MNRRGFLAGLAASLAALFGLPGLAALLDPAFRGGAGRWIDLGPLDALPVGEPRRFTFPVRAGWETRERVGFLVRKGDEVIALDATCTHAGCLVHAAAGESGGAPGAEPGSSDEPQAFVCPCHGGAFSLEGEPVKKPVKTPLARFETRVEDGQVRIRVRA